MTIKVLTIVAITLLLHINGCVARSFKNNEYFEAASIKDAIFPQQNNVYRSGMNWTQYQPLEVIYNFMQELNKKYPKLTELYTIGKTYEGRELKVLRISEDPVNYKKIWIDGGIHAREWISPATVTRIMDQLLSNWEHKPGFLKKITWYFMPVMNPDGYEYSRRPGERIWRKNRSPVKNSTCIGVDLNRNFNIAWATTIGSSNDPCQDEYHGPSAGSELETQAVTKFLLKNQKNLLSYLTYHNYGQNLIYPWSYKKEEVENVAELKKIANKTAELIREYTGADYIALSGFDYSPIRPLPGGSDDWARSALNTRYVYTVELRDKGPYFFVLPPQQIIPTGLDGITVAYAIAATINNTKSNN